MYHLSFHGNASMVPLCGPRSGRYVSYPDVPFMTVWHTLIGPNNGSCGRSNDSRRAYFGKRLEKLRALLTGRFGREETMVSVGQSLFYRSAVSGTWERLPKVVFVEAEGKGKRISKSKKCIFFLKTYSSPLLRML